MNKKESDMHFNIDFSLNGLRESYKVFICLAGGNFMLAVTSPLKTIAETALKSKFISNTLYTYNLL